VLSYTESRVVDMRTVLEGSIGCIWIALVSLLESNSMSGAVFLCYWEEGKVRLLL
jgi:hypothetical protein